MGVWWRPATRSRASDGHRAPGPEAAVVAAAHHEATESPPRIHGRADDVTDELQRELRQVRPRLAKAILWLLAGTIVLHAAMLATSRWTGLAPGEVSSVFNTTFAGLMTLAGTALGFYFGEARGQQSQRDLDGRDE